MTTNFTSKLVKIRTGNYRLDISTTYHDGIASNGCFCPSFNICRSPLGWTARGDSTLLDPFHEDTLGAARTLIEHQIDHLLNPGLLNVQNAIFARNSGGFIVYTATYTAKSGVKYPIYIERPPQPTAKYTARCLLPQGGELRSEGIFPSHACWNLTDTIEELDTLQANALDKIAPTTSIAATPMDVSWLAGDDQPRTDGIYGEYREALKALDVLSRDFSKDGQERWSEHLTRCNDLRQQIVGLESRVVA